MEDEVPTYSVNMSSDDLVTLRHVLVRACICQNRDFDDSLRKRLSLNSRPPQKLILAITLCAAILPSVLLAWTKPDEILGRLFLGGLAATLWIFFFAILLLGQDGLRASIRKYFTDPLVRSTVNCQLAQSFKLAPFSVVYCFHATHYTAIAAELKSERTIVGDEISLAYYWESVYCLFEKESSQGWKAVIWAVGLEHRDMVETFLKRNQVEICELGPDGVVGELGTTEVEIAPDGPN
jgi:hypothetical protein